MMTSELWGSVVHCSSHAKTSDAYEGCLRDVSALQAGQLANGTAFGRYAIEPNDSFQVMAFVVE